MEPSHIIQNGGPFSKLPSSKIVQKIFQDLLLVADAKNARLVCREWNVAVTNLLTFAVKLSDMTILPFLQIRRAERYVLKLNVIFRQIVPYHIASDLSPLSAPFSPEALQDQIKCPKNMKALHFLEGVTPSVKQTFLTAFKWIEILKFEKTPVVNMDGIILENLTKFEMNPGAYNESDELKLFFHHVHFPSLRETSIQIHGDYLLYAAVHCFVARHHLTLNSVKILFLESLTMISGYDGAIYAKDFQEIILQQKKNMEEQNEYQQFLIHLPSLQLSSLNLWLIDNEEFLTLSLKLIDVQKNLRVLDINHPYGYRDNSTNFNSVIQNNYMTLRKITIPRLPQFDCRILKDCKVLEEFSLGMEFNFYDFENFGSVINVEDFPWANSKIKSISMGSPMTKNEIYWMVSHVAAHTFLFIGDHSDGEYSLIDAQKIVEFGSANKRALMMCVPMSQDTFKQLQVYLQKHVKIGVRVIYHCRPNELISGTAHFSLYFGNNQPV